MDDHHGLGAANAGAPDDGWTVPQPDTLPRPTWWPAVFALGSILVLWGFITSLIITGVGAVLFLAAVAGWIGELRHEHRS